MAARPLPLWYAQPRGTAITSLAVLDDEVEQEGFMSRYAHNLVNLVNGGPAAVIGFLVVLSMLVTVPAAGAAVSGVVVVLLALIPLAWCGLAAWAGLAVFRDGEDAPPWARGLVAFLIIAGKVATVTFVVTTVIIALCLLFGTAMGFASMGRD